MEGERTEDEREVSLIVSVSLVQQQAIPHPGRHVLKHDLVRCLEAGVAGGEDGQGSTA